MASMILEPMQYIPHIHEWMPEPFDITNHAGNMVGGTAVAIMGSLAYGAKNQVKNDSPELEIDTEAMQRFRKFGVAAICGVTALANCVTETRWGVQHLPVARWLNGTTPDILDTTYSTLWAGGLSFAFWRKTK